MSYRSGGFSIAILKDLVNRDGSRIRPKPLNCIVFFTTFDCFFKLAVNLPLVLDRFADKMWLRIAFDQIYWIIGVVGCAFYLVGMLYAIPMTRYSGIFAYYEPDVIPGYTDGYSIRVIYPSPKARDLFLASSFLGPTIFCAGPAIASGVMHDHGYYEAAEMLRTIRHINWIGIFYTIPIIAFYYSVKFALILYANIRLAESTLRVEPKIAFTVEYLLTMSPVRFLVLLMTFTTFGAGAISIVCGSVTLSVLIYREQILSSEHRVFAIGFAFVWTCLLGVGLFLELGMIAIQSFRKKRREQRRLFHSFYTDRDPHGSGQRSSVPHGCRMALYSSGMRDSRIIFTENVAALQLDPTKHYGLDSGTQFEIPLMTTPTKVRALETRNQTKAWESSSGQDSYVFGSLSSHVVIEYGAVSNTLFSNRYSIVKSDSSSAVLSEESCDESLSLKNYSEAHSKRPRRASQVAIFEELSGAQDWRDDGVDSEVYAFTQQASHPSGLSQQHLRQHLQQQQRQQQLSERLSEKRLRSTSSQLSHDSESPHDECHRLRTTAVGLKPATQQKSPRRTKSFNPQVPRRAAVATPSNRSMVRQQQSLEHITMGSISFGIDEELQGRQQQENLQDSVISAELQLRQQHPQHRVAFKGLSPPPRSPTSPTENLLALGPWSSSHASIAMERMQAPRVNTSIDKVLMQTQSLGDIRSSLFFGVGDNQKSYPYTLRFNSDSSSSARSNYIDTALTNEKPKRRMKTPISPP
ncbi:hypothetical protein BGZ75_004635 [Mortierella antarctica]|nr:hypothetical protein BGZ75_004635 [Mortierella antarctica]